MPKLVDLNGLAEDSWKVLDKDFEGTAQAGQIVPFQHFLANTDSILATGNIGVWIDSDESPEELPANIEGLPVIAINFPKFIDGRGYSIARYVRERLGYTGELRAIGDVLLDQLFFLKRCGFSTFALREDQNVESATQYFSDFSEPYQAANDLTTPLFRRR
jgi:uncharacterized protein (DUF934 family)